MAKHKVPTKCPRKSKDCTKDCFNCPFAYLSTLANPISIITISSLIKNNYSLMNVDAVHEYHSEHWKPPDTLCSYI